jgi:hypothetical protein
MQKSAQGKPFKLPKVSWSHHGVKLLSFRQDMHRVFGEYLPGEGAVVFDPLWTRALSPQAIAQHESQHQFLGNNTAFGLFTQMLFSICLRGFPIDVLRKCLTEQWCVQELAATYSEMTYLAGYSPDLLREQVRKLPSGRLDEPPYREVFEAMDYFMPVEPGGSKELLSAQAILVTVLTAASMNSDCLLRMASGPGTESGLLACMDDSPSSRLEQIMDLLLAKNLLHPLLAETVKQYSRPEGSAPPKKAPGVLLLQRLISLVPEVKIQADDEVAAQAMRAGRVCEAITGVKMRIKREAAEPMVKIMESREKEEKSLAANPPRQIPATELRNLLTQAVRNYLGLTLELAIKNTNEAYVTARRQAQPM